MSRKSSAMQSRQTVPWALTSDSHGASPRADILEQFLCRMPMLAQANASKQGVLQLLQG
jgi:hypothetical protein